MMHTDKDPLHPLDHFSIATEQAIVSLGDAIVTGVARGYDAAAKSTEEIVFPVKVDEEEETTENRAWRKEDARARGVRAGAIGGRESERVEREKKSAERAPVGLVGAGAMDEREPQKEEKKSARRLLVTLPSLRRSNKSRPRQQRPSQAKPEKKNSKFRLKLFNR